jgi:uncharacterized protein (TIGR03437 family)
MRLGLFILIPMLTIAGEFTTSLGDTYPYMISAITTDSAGNTYVVGSRALALPFPAIGFRIGTDGLSSLPGGSDVFVSKLDPNGKLLFTDTFAGKGNDVGLAITLDPSGNIYIAGTTTSDDFPLSKALQTQPSTYGTGFIIKLTNDGTTTLYSTYFGSTLGATSISALATDSKGNLYLTGMTGAPDFPHTSGMPFGRISPSGPSQQTGAIIASISAAGDKILYSGALVGTALACPGGSSCFLSERATAGVGIAVDAAGNAYIAGNTNTTDLPTTLGTLSPRGIGAFIAKVNANGSGLSYLTYLGADQTGENSYITGANILHAIAADAAGNAYLAGQTPNKNGVAVLVLAKLKPDGTALGWASYSSSATLCGTSGFNGGDTECSSTSASAQSIAVDASGNVWASGTALGPNLPGHVAGTGGPWLLLSGHPTSLANYPGGTEFLVGVNAAGSFAYAGVYPAGTVAQSVALDPSGLVHVAGTNGFVSAITPTTPPTMKILAFQNAFGGNVTARISPAEVISIYGPGIGPATSISATPTNGFYPTTFSSVQVQINGSNIPLLYVSTNQINAVVPMGLAIGASAIVRVINGTAISADYPVRTIYAAPQAFPAVLNQDGTINSQTNPAKSGSVVTFYATGWQSSFSPLTDGQADIAAQDACLGNCYAEATIGTDYAVLYGGAAPGIIAGVTQFNVRIGTTIPASPSAVQIDLFISGPALVTQSLWVTP